MIKAKKFLVILFLFSTIHMAFADPSTQNYFNKWAKENGIVGAALAVNNEKYFYGYSDKYLKKPVTDKTQFGIGSITKTFISVILLKLEAENKLNIHDPITKYLPQYPKLKKVSIKSLMQMTAGFNDDVNASNSINPIQQIDAAYAKYNPTLIGQWQYSNVSYQLLGILIEKITQKSLAQTLSTLITLPLQLNSIYFPDSHQAYLLKEYQNGHSKITNFNNTFAAGGLVSNAQDLETFIHHLFVIKDVLPAKQYKELTTFVNTPKKYYAFTGTNPPQFGMGVFKWNIPGIGNVLTYPGVLQDGFTSAYVVVGNNIIISQSNTYNKNDFTLLWPHRAFIKGLINKFYMHESNQ